MSKQIKKLTLRYAYLKLEKEEVDEICLGVEGEMRTYLEKHYPEHYRSFFMTSPETEEETQKEHPLPLPEVEEKKEEAIPPKNKDLKRLYRKIAEKTHPDKVGTNQYAELFSEAAAAYASNDIAKMLDIAGTANIELVELSPESISLLKNNIKNLSEDIDMKKTTTAWAWSMAGSEEEKENIIKFILKHRGVEL